MREATHGWRGDVSIRRSYYYGPRWYGGKKSECDGISEDADNGWMRLQVRITTDDPSWLSHQAQSSKERNHPGSQLTPP